MSTLYVPSPGDKVIYKKSLDSHKNSGKEQQNIPAVVVTFFPDKETVTIQPLTPGVSRKVVKRKYLELLRN